MTLDLPLIHTARKGLFYDWLKEKGSLGMYRVDDQKLIGNPRSNRALSATYYIEISGEEIEITKDIVYRYNDPEAGPIYRPLEIVPAISVKLKEKVYVLSNERPTKLSVSVKALSANQSGTVSLPVPKGWKITPTQHDFSIDYKGADQNLEFELAAEKRDQIEKLRQQFITNS